MRWGRLLLRLGVVLIALWCLLAAGLALAMRQPPETFGRVMKHVPVPFYFILPFESLWTWSRAGNLNPGDPAPDFTLPTVDKTSQFHLAADRQGHPVVLVFGSYT